MSSPPPPTPPGQPPYSSYPDPWSSSPTPPGPPAYWNVTPTQPPSKAMAIWALVLAILPIPITWLVGIGLAVAVLVRSRDGREHGKGLAIAALVIAPLWIIATAGLIALAIAEAPERDPAGAVQEGGDVSVTELRKGDCLPKGIEVDKETLTVEVTPCSKPHAHEVYAVFDLAAGQYPGDKNVVRLAEGGCARRFEAFIGVGYDKSELDMYYYYPLASSWSVDRSVTCTVADASPTTGSLEGSKR